MKHYIRVPFDLIRINDDWQSKPDYLLIETNPEGHLLRQISKKVDFLLKAVAAVDRPFSMSYRLPSILTFCDGEYIELDNSEVVVYHIGNADNLTRLFSFQGHVNDFEVSTEGLSLNEWERLENENYIAMDYPKELT